MSDSFFKYARQTALRHFGEAGQRRLEKSKLVVVGVGGVGSSALPLLSGAGIGLIEIVDFDVVSESNLHRQTIYRHADIGLSKAESAARSSTALNPDIETVAHSLFLQNHVQLAPILDGAEICIDATDSFSARFLISEACAAANINCISASAEGWVSQLVCFGGDFRMENFVCDKSAASETSRGMPIFGPAAALSGVWAAGLALRVLAGVEDFIPGKFERYSFDGNKHVCARL